MRTKNAKLEDEVDQLIKEIDKTLNLSKDHHTWLKITSKSKHELEPTASAPLENKLSIIPTTSDSPMSDGVIEGKVNIKALPERNVVKEAQNTADPPQSSAGQNPTSQEQEQQPLNITLKRTKPSSCPGRYNQASQL